jgi:peptide/nickel transport system substrate-binding protein
MLRVRLSAFGVALLCLSQWLVVEVARCDDERTEDRLGDLAPEFSPPTLEQLNKSKTWVPRTVDLAIQRLRRQREKKSLASTMEALELKNDSPEDNRKIASALGRLPKDDEEVDWDATLHRHITGNIRSLNPLLISTMAEFEIAGLTSFGLFSFDGNFEPFADGYVVKNWHTSDDGLVDKVELHDHLTWSDGKPITAHDVEFSYRAIMTSAVPVPAVRAGTDQLLGVKAYDDRTLVYFHQDKLATNVWNLNFPIIPKHVYAESILKYPTLQNSDYHVALERKPVVGGAFEIVKRTPGVSIELRRRDDAFKHEGKPVGERPYFKSVVFHNIPRSDEALAALKAGTIDEMQLTVEQWRKQTNGDDFYEKNTKAFGLEYVSFHFGWNCESPLFEDKRVRHAMSLAFDHDKMLKKLRHGLDQPCTGIFHPSSRWAPRMDPSPLKRDKKRAKQLLDEAGWKDTDGDGIRDRVIDGKKTRFEFRMMCSPMPERLAICALLRQNLKKVGVNCEVQPIEWASMRNKLWRHEYEAHLGGWGTGTDPDTSSNLWVTDAPRNYGGYSSEKVDQLFEEGRRELDPKKRAKIYAQIHKIIWDDQPYTWLYYRNAHYGFSKELRGYNFSPRGPYAYGPGVSSLWKPVKR